MATLALGRYPTPVHELSQLSGKKARLWIKRDDLSGKPYGGNKVRKLERILAQAQQRGARRLVTFGAAGSHHVLATTIYGKLAGFRVAAALVPQVRTPHAETTLGTALAWGLEPWPIPSVEGLWHLLRSRWNRFDFVVPAGGSSPEGALGYVDAVRELSAQIAAGTLPLPDVIVVALGSGGTASGLLAGVASLHMRTRIVGVRVVSPYLAGSERTVRLARRALRTNGERISRSKLAEHFELEPRHLGAGYGHPTSDGMDAIRAADACGITLDPTYTAKAFSAALERVRAGREAEVLYWHTLSAYPGDPPGDSERAELPGLPPALSRQLFR